MAAYDGHENGGITLSVPKISIPKSETENPQFMDEGTKDVIKRLLKEVEKDYLTKLPNTKLPRDLRSRLNDECQLMKVPPSNSEISDDNRNEENTDSNCFEDSAVIDKAIADGRRQLEECRKGNKKLKKELKEAQDKLDNCQNSPKSHHLLKLKTNALDIPSLPKFPC